MKERLININLTNEVQPRSIEQSGQDWVSYGDGEYKNNYPQYLIDLYNNSATNSAIINATASMIAGDDFLVDDTDNLEQYVALKKFLATVNSKETAHELFVKLAFDLKLQGAYAINVIWSKDRKHIAELHHIPVEQVRVGVPDDRGVHCYFLSTDWTKYRKKEHEPKKIDAFNMMDRTSGSQLLYSGLYSPAMELYHTPDYVASTNWIQVDNLTSDYHLNNISNGFSGSYFINFANGVPTREERVQIERQITQKFTGSNNAGKFVLTFSDDANSKPEIIPISISDADKQYTVLNELCIQNIMIGHRVTSPMLLGVKTEGQLGGRGELLQAYELYMNSVIKPFQNTILKTFKKLLAINGITASFSIKDVKPLNSMFDADTLKDVLTQDEIREELGYAPLQAQEEAVAEEQQLSEFTALDKFLTECGEEEDTENWELIDEQELNDDDEHSDFDFEYNLNQLANKTNLARTGEARKRGSKQDGKDDEGNLYRVRYQYSAKRKSHRHEREFCRKMMMANKIYRKEDIVKGQAHALGSIAANKGFGPNGSDVYDIWLYKGGVNCHHKWVRKIYVTKSGDRPDYNTDEIINKTKARSRGFRPEENDQRIYQAPIDMPKQGRL
ncbi:MAG: putative portal protein [Prokaryotic dsDNA virus sp.]|nr:MAG: putative portal protein [Prokaryotic dsDNA virus sp.]